MSVEKNHRQQSPADQAQVCARFGGLRKYTYEKNVFVIEY